MRIPTAAAILALLALSRALAQPPSIPPRAIAGPPLDVARVPLEATFEMPDGLGFESVAAVAIDDAGHVVVLHRGAQPLVEFDEHGRFVRAFGEGLYRRSHGLRIDADGNFWTTDVAAHVVMKLDPAGEILMTLGTRGESGDWDEAAGKHVFDEPNDVALDSEGNVYVAQGHGRGEPRILKFDAAGRLLDSWGGRGTLPGQFAVAHSIVIDDDDLVYVADRENRRIQVFDTEGRFVKGWLFYGMACGLALEGEFLYMTTGFDGQVVKLDKASGDVLGVTGMPGSGPGELGEAHFLAASEDEQIFVADVVNRRVQKYVGR